MNASLDRYLRALDAVTPVVDGAREDRWDGASPCPDWSARELLGHVIDGQRQILALVTGEGPRRPVTDRHELGRLAGTEPRAGWHAACQEAVTPLRRCDPAAVVATPLGERTVADVLDIAVIEPLVHAWDLAVATGQAITLDEEAVAAVLPGVQALGGRLAATGMYQPARAVPQDASPEDRLLAALGRDPRA